MQPHKSKSREHRAKTVMDLLKQLEGNCPVSDRHDFPQSMETWVAPSDDIPVLQPKKTRKSNHLMDESIKLQLHSCGLDLDLLDTPPKQTAPKTRRSADKAKPWTRLLDSQWIRLIEKKQIPVQAIIGLCIVVGLVCKSVIGYSSATGQDNVGPGTEPLLTMQTATHLLPVQQPVAKSETDVVKTGSRSHAPALGIESSGEDYLAAIASAMDASTDKADSESVADGFLITLSNGSQILTNTYWEDEYQVYFREGENMIGLPRAMIRNVDKSRFSRNAVSPAMAKKVEKAPEENPLRLSDDEDRKGYMKGYYTLKRKFGNVAQMTEDEIYQFSEDLLMFRNEVLQTQRGILYDNQIQAVYAMLDNVEQIIVPR